MIQVSLPSGPLGLVLEPVIKFAKVQKGCRVRESKILSPGTVIVAVDSVYVKDNPFRDIVKMIKHSSTRRITIDKVFQKTEHESTSPANLIREIMSTEKYRPTPTIPSSSNNGDLEYSCNDALEGLQLFGTPQSVMKINSTLSPHSFASFINMDISPQSLASPHPNKSENKNIIITQASKMDATRGRSETQPLNKVSFQKLQVNQRLLDRTLDQSDVLSVSDTTAADTCLDISVMTDQQKPSKHSVDSPLVNRKMRVVIAAHEQLQQLQETIQDRERRIVELESEIEGLKMSSRGSDGKVMFLQFQLRRLQQEQRHDLHVSSCVNNSSVGTQVTPVKSRDGLGNTATLTGSPVTVSDRQALLLHWSRTRPLLAGIEATSGAHSTASVSVATGSTNGAVPVGRAVGECDGDAMRVLQRQLMVQKRVTALLEGQMRDWVNGSIREAWRRAEEEVGAATHGPLAPPSSIPTWPAPRALCEGATESTRASEKRSVPVEEGAPGMAEGGPSYNVIDRIMNCYTPMYPAHQTTATTVQTQTTSSTQTAGNKESVVTTAPGDCEQIGTPALTPSPPAPSAPSPSVAAPEGPAPSDSPMVSAPISETENMSPNKEPYSQLVTLHPALEATAHAVSVSLPPRRPLAERLTDPRATEGAAVRSSAGSSTMETDRKRASSVGRGPSVGSGLSSNDENINHININVQTADPVTGRQQLEKTDKGKGRERLDVSAVSDSGLSRFSRRSEASAGTAVTELGIFRSNSVSDMSVLSTVSTVSVDRKRAHSATDRDSSSQTESRQVFTYGIGTSSKATTSSSVSMCSESSAVSESSGGRVKRSEGCRQRSPLAVPVCPSVTDQVSRFKTDSDSIRSDIRRLRGTMRKVREECVGVGLPE